MKLKFSASLSFYRDLRLMVWQPRGVLDEAHVEQLIVTLEQAEEEAEHPFNRYTDLTKVEEVDLSFDYVLRVSLYRRVLYAEGRPVKSAFFVGDKATARIALTHAVVARGSPLQVEVFLNRSAAAQWLEVGVEDLTIDR